MPGSLKCGKRAKWIRWDIKRPGVAPCEGHFEIYGSKMAETIDRFQIWPWKKGFLFTKTYRKNL